MTGEIVEVKDQAHSQAMVDKPKTIRGREDWKILLITLAVASLFGAAWIGLIAAWEHHDEPNHFQYVRMLLDQKKSPASGEQDFHLNRQILKSMIWNGFFARMGNEPPLPSPKSPVYLPGFSQFEEPPAYYWLASIGAYLLRNENITRQMFGVRIISFILYLATILAAWGIAIELFPSGHPLRWMVPVSLALLPGFVDIMTAVNNDAGAVAVVSFFLWVCVRLIRYGFRWVDFMLSLFLAGLAWQTKSSAAIVVPLLPVALLFSILRGRWIWLAWTSIFILAGGILILSFQKDDAAFYYRSTAMNEPTRVKREEAVLGEWVLQVDESSSVTPTWMAPLFQPVPLETVSPYLGKPVTLGIWMWANQPVTALTPKVTTQKHEYVQTVQLTEEPIFYTVEAILEADNQRLWVSFDPLPFGSEDAVVYYDGLVLADGLRPLDEPPVYDDNFGSTGTWGNEPFTNMLRNGSAEVSSMRLRKIIDDLGAKVFPDHIRPSLIITSILDRDGAGWYYQAVANRLLLTFWGYFGWTHIPLEYPWLYSVLNFLAFLGVIGSLVAMVRNWRRIQWSIVFLFGLSVILMGGAVLARGVIYLSFQNMFIPVARYLMPVVIPIMILLTRGWLEVGNLCAEGFRRITGRKTQEKSSASISWVSYSVYLSVWLLLDLAAIYSVVTYYQGLIILR